MVMQSVSSQTDTEAIIVGGGIQGLGVLHDICSRGIEGVFAFEEKAVASGTSSRSTKLVHGGLRYLEQFSQWGLVREALRERTLLLKLIPSLVTPLPFILPVFKNTRPSWMVRLGLGLYDLIGGNTHLPKSKKLSESEVLSFAPYLKLETYTHQDCFLYYDAQMLDDVIAKVVAFSAKKLGGNVWENSKVISVKPKENGSGFFVEILRNNQKHFFSTKAVVNASGAWNNSNLLNWGITPHVPCLLNLGTHIIFKADAVNAQPQKSAATLLQNEDGRVVFFIPWNGSWLFGTTESILDTHPNKIQPPQQDKNYLVECAQKHIQLNFPAEECIQEIFTGIRTMPVNFKNKILSNDNHFKNPFESPFYIKSLDKSISKLSRETVIDETVKNMFSIYGGKYTTYRSQSEKIGALICSVLNKKGSSKTNSSESWFIQEMIAQNPLLLQSDSSLRSN
jgi:glycerol-3-phosphate dehydrogenase